MITWSFFQEDKSWLSTISSNHNNVLFLWSPLCRLGKGDDIGRFHTSWRFAQLITSFPVRFGRNNHEQIFQTPTICSLWKKLQRPISSKFHENLMNVIMSLFVNNILENILYEVAYELFPEACCSVFSIPILPNSSKKHKYSQKSSPSFLHYRQFWEIIRKLQKPFGRFRVIVELLQNTRVIFVDIKKGSGDLWMCS